MTTPRAHLLTCFATLACSTAFAAFTLEKTPSGGVVVKCDGAPFAEYVVDQANKPYLAPVFGPTGKQMTRSYPMAKVPGETYDHPHHRGICFGNEDIGGFETWAERTTYEEQEAKKPGSAKGHLSHLGAIKHREYKELTADVDHAVIVAVSDVVDPTGKHALTEVSRMTFRSTSDTRSIDYDIDYIADGEPILFGDKKDAGFSIRIPTSMAVDSKQGGQIITSEGITDAKAWGTRAKWCDYHGPVEGETLGVAILNHPSSFRYPTPWHVRTYGLFTANAFGTHSLDKAAENGDYTLGKDQHLKLRHRLIFHKGDEKAAKIAEAFETYAKENP